jgi:hypothetical protein
MVPMTVFALLNYVKSKLQAGVYSIGPLVSQSHGSVIERSHELLNYFAENLDA